MNTKFYGFIAIFLILGLISVFHSFLNHENNNSIKNSNLKFTFNKTSTSGRLRSDAIITKREIVYINNCSSNNENKSQIINKTVDKLSQIRENPVDAVFRFVHLPLDYGYGSNAIPLTVATLITNGDILELGMGSYSTPLLHNIASDQNRKLVSVDTDLKWLNRFILYNTTSNHLIRHLTNDEILKFGEDKQWGMVLVDHIFGPKRHLNVINLARKAQIVVLHDAERIWEKIYQYETHNIRSFYNFTCKYNLFTEATKKDYISTILLSNFLNVTELSSLFDKIKTDYGHVACNTDL